MSQKIRAFAADAQGGAFKPFEYDPGPLAAEHVEVAVEHCGVCHSDLSMLDNEWKRTVYPFVPGHEVVGRVTAAGAQVKGIKEGDRVGIGWFAGSCMHCMQCIGGDHHLCAETQGIIVGRHGGFADRVRSHWAWAVKLPDTLDHAAAGPLFCGGITVFNPIVQFGVKPTDHVGVVGIGGLGHMALKFLRAWGCEVTAFTSSEAKHAEAKQLGAHHAVSSTQKDQLKKLRGSLDFILVTVNVPLDWPVYVAALRPRGRLHIVGAILEPMNLASGALMGGQKSLSSSPVGSPAVMRQMLEFCARHKIAPQVERYPLAKVNDAMDHLRAGKARYRIVLDAT